MLKTLQPFFHMNTADLLEFSQIHDCEIQTYEKLSISRSILHIVHIVLEQKKCYQFDQNSYLEKIVFFLIFLLIRAFQKSNQRFSFIHSHLVPDT